MVKPIAKSLKKTITNELGIQLELFLKKSDYKELPPYLGRISFEDRLLEVEEKLRYMFGLAYCTDSQKILKLDKTYKNLVATLCNFEKHVKGFMNVQLNPIGLLKEILENDAPFLVCDDLYILGIERDRSGLSKNQKNKIAKIITRKLDAAFHSHKFYKYE